MQIIREATADDAAATCEVLARSIVELCTADHRNDPAILARWLRNKTPEQVKEEIMRQGNSVLVAVEDAAIIGVGLVTDAGEIGLNYVSPDARFRGVSRAIMAALETRAGERGNTRCTLTSTETARQFYLSGGYTQEGEAVLRFPGDCPGYKMFKPLTTAFEGSKGKPSCQTTPCAFLCGTKPRPMRLNPFIPAPSTAQLRTDSMH